jgi:hypothetical protein
MNDVAWKAWAQQLATGLVLVDAQLRLCWLNPADPVMAMLLPRRGSAAIGAQWNRTGEEAVKGAAKACGGHMRIVYLHQSETLPMMVQ